MAYGSTLSAEADAPEARKARGAFFTPPELARYVCAFAIRKPSDEVLEPSCGEGEFLLCAAERLRGLGASEGQASKHLRGYELHAQSAAAARRRLRDAGLSPSVREGDFFAQEPDSHKVSAVVGNPPYVRYQDFSGEERRRALSCARAAHVKLSALTSSWAPFVAHATRFLETGGRLGLVLPAELLSTNYAGPIRRLLLERFSSVSVVLFDGPVFPEVQEEVVLLLADGFETSASRGITFLQASSVRELPRASASFVEVSGEDRWPAGGVAVAATRLMGNCSVRGLVPLGEYGSVRLGAVTGSNAYFSLTSAQSKELGLLPSDVVRICPPGSHHLRSLSFGEDTYEQLSASGKKVLLFLPQAAPSPAAKRYIALGESTGVSNAYKCRTRSPWWRVPGVRPCDLFLTYMNGYGPNLCSNDGRLGFLNSVHGVFLREGAPPETRELLPLAALCSATLLSAELVGRSYGGGILKLEPREAARMLVVSPELLSSCARDLRLVRPEADLLLLGGRRADASLLVDEILLPPMGFSRDEQRQVRHHLEELRLRREQRGKRREAERGA